MNRNLLFCIAFGIINYGNCQTAPVLVKDLLPGGKSSLVDENSSNQNLEGTSVNGKLIFKGASNFTTDVNGTVIKTFKVMVTDGTSEGTKVLKEINAKGSCSPRSFYTFKNQAFFSATEGTADVTENGGERMWVSDGTTEGTKIFKNIGFRSFFDGLNSPNVIALDNGKFLFVGDSARETGRYRDVFLFISDGTEGGTYMLKDFNPAKISGFNASGNPGNLTKLSNGKIVFTASSIDYGREVFVTDGTRAGTVLLKDINPGTASMLSWQDGFTTLHSDGKKVYFFANNGVVGAELWCTDGTTDGTKLLKDINPGAGKSSSNNFSWETIGNITYFKASTPETGDELYQTDGTTEGTKLTLDFQKGAKAGLQADIVQLSNKLIFVGTSTDRNYKLVSLNPATNQLDTLINGYTRQISKSNIYCDKLYLVGSAFLNKTSVTPLAVTDGTPAGSGLILNDNQPENSTTSFSYFGTSVFKAGDFLLFASGDKSQGLELFKIPLCNSFNTAVEATSTEDNVVSANDVKIYPNPSNGNFSIDVPKGLNYGLLTITDLSGKMVWKQAIDPNSLEFNTSLPDGMYVVNIKNEKMNIYKKLSVKNNSYSMQ